MREKNGVWLEDMTKLVKYYKFGIFTLDGLVTKWYNIKESLCFFRNTKLKGVVSLIIGVYSWFEYRII